MRQTNDLNARTVAHLVSGALALFAGVWLVEPAPATEAIPGLFENSVTWSDDGAIDATLHDVEFTGGVTGNFWPDLGSYRSIGQSFRCPGPVLAAVQLGLGDADTGYLGLTYRAKGPAVTIRLRRDGPGGEIVAERTYAAQAMRPDLLLPVDVPTAPAMRWYVEVTAEPHHAESGKNNILNANWDDSYPGGSLYLNGRQAKGDLHVRIHRRRHVTATRPGAVILWAAPPQERVWLEPQRTLGAMLGDDANRPIRIDAAGREWATVQLVASPRPGYEIDESRLHVEPFQGPDGARLDASHFRIEALRYLKNFRRGNTSGVLYPDPLAPQSTTDTSDYPPAFKRANHGFVFSVHVPDGTPAGVYRSTASVTLNGGLTLTRPIELRVHDFSLPRETHTRTGLFKDLANKSLEQHLALTEDLASFRIAIGYPFQWDHTQVLRRHGFSERGYADALGTVMQASLVRTGELLNERGLTLTTVTPWADTYRLFRGEDPEAARQGIIRFWQTYYPILEAHGWTEQAHARMVDEVDGEELRRTHEAAALFREYAPGVDLMVTAIGTPDRTVLAQAIGLADIWCPSSRYLARAMDFYQSRIEAGEQVWPYIHDHAFLATDAAGPRLFFWMLQKYNLQGACYFSIRRARVVHTWFGLEQHTDTWAGDGDLYFAPPEGSDAPWWRSLRLHLMRDGIEDREYFLLLDHLAEAADERGMLNNALAEEVRRSRGWLDRIAWGATSFSSDASLVDEARRDVAATIEALQDALAR